MLPAMIGITLSRIKPTGASHPDALNFAKTLVFMDNLSNVLWQIALSLNVEAMSLYKHVANKDDLLDGLVELVFSKMNLPTPDMNWKEAVRERGYTVRNNLNRHPWAAGLFESRASLGPTRLRHQNNMIGILRKDGFSIELAYHALITLASYTYGFVIMEQAWFMPEEPTKAVASKAPSPAPISLDEFPHLLEMINFVRGRGGENTPNVVRPERGLVTEFEFGLNLLIEGFEKKLETH